MFTWSPYPFIRITVAFIIGILISRYQISLVTSANYWPFILSALFGTGLILWINRAKYGHFIFGNLCLIVLIILGMVRSNTIGPKYVDVMKDEIQGYIGTIDEAYSGNKKHESYKLNVTKAIISNKLESFVISTLIYIKNDSTSQLTQKLKYGDRLFIYGSPQLIPKPHNPHGFDYQQFMLNSGIRFQHYIHSDSYIKVGSHMPNPIIKYANDCRLKVEMLLDDHIDKDRERSIAKALILGNKGELDSDTKRIYATAGAMHVLAVSGLHIGVIYMIVSFLFRSIRKKRIGKYIFSLTILFILWSYALITGLSPSILRAATMFSIVIIGESISGKSNIYNSLAVSAFILLLYDPNLLFSVGFQLSYIAVFGIVFITPRIASWFHFNNICLDFIWRISSVSLAAQFITFPLTIYYFNQFPTYFLLSNVVVIPGTFVIMMSALFFLISTLTPYASWIGWVLQSLIYLLNECMEYVESFQFSLITPLYLDEIQTWLLYLMIATFLSFINTRRKYLFYSLCLIIVVFTTHSFYEVIEGTKNYRIIAYHKNQGSILDDVSGLRANLISYNYNHPKQSINSIIEPYRIANLCVSKTDESSIQLIPSKFDGLSLFVRRGKKYVFISTSIDSIKIDKKLTGDYIVIQNNAVTSLKQLDNKFVYEHIIIGSSNNPWLDKRLLKEGMELKKSIRSIRKEGMIEIG